MSGKQLTQLGNLHVRIFLTFIELTLDDTRRHGQAQDGTTRHKVERQSTERHKMAWSSNVLYHMAQPCEGSRTQKHCSVDLLEYIFIALLAL